MIYLECFEIAATQTLKNDQKKRMQWSSHLLTLHEYIQQTTIRLKTQLQILFWKCSERKGFLKFRDFQKRHFQNYALFCNVTGTQSIIPNFIKNKLQEKCFA